MQLQFMTGSMAFSDCYAMLRYVYVPFSNWWLCCRTKPVSFTDTDEPRHITLALTGNPTEMRVTWNSASSSNALLVYGVEGTSQNHTVIPNTSTYTANDMCGNPAKTQGWRDPGYIHTAIITVIAFFPRSLRFNIIFKATPQPSPLPPLHLFT